MYETLVRGEPKIRMNKIIFNKIFLLLVILLPLQINAETVIHNSVSVSSNGGVSTTHVKTIHNGEVIEDTTIATTSPINYHSEYEDSSVTIQTNSDTSNINNGVDVKLEKLNALIKELLIILAHYEKLFAK